MTGFAVVLVLVLIPLSALTIATRRQPVAAGSGVVSIKRKGRAMTQGETLTIGRASLDAVVRERDNAVERARAAERELNRITADSERDRKQENGHLNVLIDKLRKDNATLKADNERLVTMAAQWAGAKDPARMTVIDRDRLARLEALEEYARVTIGELVGLVDEPGYVEVSYDEERWSEE